MRIHTDVLTRDDIIDAAKYARVDLATFTDHGSKSRARAFNVKLEGESRRRPNGGASGAGSGYAATWDQWGVFLAVLFDKDPRMVTPYYSNKRDFNYQTLDRFQPRGTWTDDGERDGVTFWPRDAHGDHKFEFSGIPYRHDCTKCSASKRWR